MREHDRLNDPLPRTMDRRVKPGDDELNQVAYWVYILASKPGGTLYVGVTNDLVRRIYEHREGLAEGFTKRYGVKTLVDFEPHETMEAALQREKNVKHWSREWKIDLIVAGNPDWRDLYDEIVK
jgi:putative endonuclease